MDNTETAAAPVSQPAHRKYVGPHEKYDLATAGQFSLMVALGLREGHTLLDIGCGSLRAGRLFLPYLLPERYFGIEPNQWLIDDAIKSEVGQSLIDIKRPTFSNDANFTLTTFGRTFDFMVAQSVFSHATAAQIWRCLSEAKAALAPTGIFAATYFVGDEDHTGTEWVYPGRVHYRAETMAKMAADAGLVCRPVNWTHTHQQTWVVFTHPEAADAVPEIADTARLAVLEHQVKAVREIVAAYGGLHGIKLLKRVNRALFGKRVGRDDR